MNDSNVSEEGPAEWTAQSKEEVENQDPKLVLCWIYN